MWVRSLGREDPLEEVMATHSSIIAWRIPWTEEPGGLQSIESQSWTQLNRISPKTYHDHFVMYKNIKSLCCTPESNIVLWVNYASIKKRKKKHWYTDYCDCCNKIPASNLADMKLCQVKLLFCKWRKTVDSSQSTQCFSIMNSLNLHKNPML